MNSFYNMGPQMNNNLNFQNFMRQFNDFRQNFTGDPREQIQKLLNSGKITPEQYQNAMQMAKNFQKFLGM